MPESLIRDGFVFVSGEQMHDLLAQTGPLRDWHDFAASWDELELDTYMADKGRYRKRRHAVFSASANVIEREAHQPHYQSRAYNALNGGIERWFAPVSPAVGSAQSLATILRFCQKLFAELAPATRTWRIEMHQFRIEAHAGQQGLPTPEGMHRDGVDYALVLMISRRNIKSGTTMIEGLDHAPLGSFTLIDAFDAALVDDGRVYHGVTPVEAINPAVPAYRDVLVITFKAK